MNYADRVKTSSSTTGTGNMTVSASAPAGFVALADAFALGTGEIPLCFAMGAEWEVSLCTLVDATTVSRDTVLASSNGGALVDFSAGTKEVFCTLSAANLVAGLVDPDDVGFDIVLCAGQSNMEGNPAWDALIDIGDSRVLQFAGSSGDAATYRKIINGADPLYMYNGPRTGKVGPATWFAKAYLSTIPSNRRVLLVPVAEGSTGLVGSVWQAGAPGGSHYELAITQSNLAIAAAQLWYPNSRFVGAIWAQGESDALASVSQAAYAAGLKAVIAGFRSRITGAANSWFVIGGMVPEYITANSAKYTPIKLAQQQVAAETDRCGYVDGVAGYANDVHYTAPGVRILGSRMGLAVRAAAAYSATDTFAPTAASAAVADATPTFVDVTLSEAMDTGFTPTASAFTVSGHTVTAGSWLNTTTLRLTVSAAFVNGEASRTVGYAQPGANNARDLAGNLLANFSGLAITNNVGVVATVPDAPTIGTATAGDGYVDVAFTAPASNGGSAVLDYTAALSTGQTATGATSPIRVTAPNGVAATATVKARNAVGSSVASAASNSVTPTGAVTYATWNPADKHASIALSNGNLTATGSTPEYRSIRATTSKTAGKWYWEVTPQSAGSIWTISIATSAALLDTFIGANTDGYGYLQDGKLYHGSGPAYGATFVANDVIGVALDLDASPRTVRFYKNGVAQPVQNIDLVGAVYPAATVNGYTAAATVNFGASAFAYTPPAGHSGLSV